MDSRVTTRHGDDGESMALNGNRYLKSHPIMEAVGGVDELRAQAALLRLLMADDSRYAMECAFVEWLLHTMFVLGSECSDPTQARPSYHPKRIGPTHLEELETEQLRLEHAAPLPRVFIAGASNRLSAQADIVCTTARRLERNIVHLKEVEPDFESQHIVPYVNRLSDYFFVLARFLEGGRHLTVDYEQV